MPPHPIYALIACDVFIEELTAFGRDSPPWHHIEFLEMGLHDRPDLLRKTLQTSIDRLDNLSGINAIVLAYGLCGNGIIGLQAGRCPLILPRAHDCVSILLGGAEPHAAILKKNPATYFYSPSWIRGKRVPGPDREAYIRDLYSQRYPDDTDMVDELVDADRDAFAHHNCAAYVDLTNNSEAAEYCKICARHLRWQFRQLTGDPSLLNDLITGNWDTKRLLTVPPGGSVAFSGDAGLLCSVP